MQQKNSQPSRQLPAPRGEGALVTPGGGRQFMPSLEQWAQIKEMGHAAWKSGMLPEAIKSAEAAAIVALKSYELGIPLMEGYAHIHVINGKPTLSREMMQTLVMQNIQGAKIEVMESTDKACKVRGSRPGIQPLTITFSAEDATRAGLMSKPIWRQYPAAMLLNRASTALFRAYFPDGLRGVSYTAEELEPSIPASGRHIDQVEPDPTVHRLPPAAAQPFATGSGVAEGDPKASKGTRGTGEGSGEAQQSRPGDFSAASSTHVSSEPHAEDQNATGGPERPLPGAPTQAMLKRLFTIATNAGWHHDNVRAYCIARWQLESSKDLTREQYDALVKAIQDQSYKEARAWLISQGIASSEMLEG